MLIRIDITYPQKFVYNDQFPPAPATLFQAIVAANSHRLDEITGTLEALEQGKCGRIASVEPDGKLKVTTACPRMPKPAEMHNFTFDNPKDKLLIPQTIFPLNHDGVHLSYYFEIQSIPLEQLQRDLTLYRLGRGESCCIANIVAVDKLEPMSSTDRLKVWEPSKTGRRMTVPYSGFLHNLRLYHDARKSSWEVHKEYETFSSTVSKFRYILYRLYDRGGETFSYPSRKVNELAGMLRHAVIGKMKDKRLAEYAAGHTDQRVQYLPLPTIGQWTDGNIRRAIIAEPVGALQLPLHSISELKLIDHSGTFVATAVRETEGDHVFSNYLCASKRWISITPVVMSGFDDRDRRKRLRLLQKMFFHASLPKPVSIVELPYSDGFDANTKHGHDKYHRLMCAVEFPDEVPGIVAAGTGRNYGLGIFANLSCS